MSSVGSTSTMLDFAQQLTLIKTLNSFCTSGFPCQLCPPGSYNNITRATTCKCCPAGYTSTYSKTGCRACHVSEWAEEGMFPFCGQCKTCVSRSPHCKLDTTCVNCLRRLSDFTSTTSAFKRLSRILISLVTIIT